MLGFLEFLLFRSVFSEMVKKEIVQQVLRDRCKGKTSIFKLTLGPIAKKFVNVFLQIFLKKGTCFTELYQFKLSTIFHRYWCNYASLLNTLF